MSEVFSDNLAAEAVGARPQPARLAKHDEPAEGVVVIATLQSIERELRRIRSFTPEYGRQFVRQDGGQVAAAATIIAFVLEGPKSGNDWYVERVGVSVNANLAAAGAATIFAGQAVDESQYIDTIVLPVGNPSRATLDGHGGAPYFIYGGGPVTILVAGLAAGNPATVRLQGREVLSGADPALRGQYDY